MTFNKFHYFLEATAVLNQVCTQLSREGGKRRRLTSSWRNQVSELEVLWCDVLRLRGGAPAWPALTLHTSLAIPTPGGPDLQCRLLVPPGLTSKINCLIVQLIRTKYKWWAQLLKYLESLMIFGSEIEFNNCFSKRCFLIQECKRLIQLFPSLHSSSSLGVGCGEIRITTHVFIYQNVKFIHGIRFQIRGLFLKPE